MLWLLYLFQLNGRIFISTQRPLRKSSTSFLQYFFAYAFQDLHCSLDVISSSRRISAMHVAIDMTRLGDFFERVGNFRAGDFLGDFFVGGGDRGGDFGVKFFFHVHAL
jgi:hypothetical protein